MNKKIKGVIEILLIVAGFLFCSYLIQKNLNFFEGLVTNNFIGMGIYFILEISSIVIAPVTTLPLVVIATNLWGWFATGILNVTAWFIGSWLAFVIARKYGIRVVKKFISLEDINKIERKIPKEHLFWSVVLLRIVIPVDVLSYALGIFSKIKTKSYLLATFIGITPFAFLFAYFGSFPVKYQVLLFLSTGILILIGWIIKLICNKCVDIFRRN